MSEPTAPAEVGAFAPLRRPVFALLWVGVLISGFGSWMQNVGAQWTFVNSPNAAVIVSIVQAATPLPMLLLALPGGVLADSFDRRHILVVTQIYFSLVSVALAVLSFGNHLTAVGLICLTLAIGAGMAIQVPTWSALIPEVLPREEVRAAARLDMVSVNLSRAAGPAVAGVVIASFGVSWTFLLNAVAVIPLLLVLVAWRRPRTVHGSSRERFLPALRTGSRYVRHDPMVRRILVRLALFIAPATSIWALLAIIATRRLGVGAGGYGLLYTAFGAGAVLGALLIPRVRRLVSTDTLLAITGVLYAVCLAGLVWVPLAVAFPLLMVVGAGWMAATSTFISELQLVLPAWVRARAIGIYMMTFTGSQAVAAPAWGLVAQWFEVQWAIVAAGALVLITTLVGLLWLPLPDTSHRDPSPVSYWGGATTLLDDDPGAGAVMVVCEYTIRPQDEAEWLEAMTHMRRSRLRTGAHRWDVFRVAETPGVFHEVFEVSSWAEHVMQHDGGRLTREDQAIEERALGFSSPPVVTRHLVPPRG